MLTQLRLSNLKSTGESVSLEFAPLTLFAGPNSAGKSTVLHSLLLLSQTLSDGPMAEPLMWNGPLVSLGSYESAVHVLDGGTRASKMGLGVTFDFAGRQTQRPPTFRGRSRIHKVQFDTWFRQRHRSNDRSSATEIAAHELIVISEPRDATAGFVEETGVEPNLITRRLAARRSKRRRMVRNAASSQFEGTLDYIVDIDKDVLKRDLWIENPTYQQPYPADLAFNHFLPDHLIYKFDFVPVYLDTAVGDLFAPRISESAEKRILSADELSSGFTMVINSLLNQVTRGSLDLGADPPTIQQLIDRVRGLRPTQREQTERLYKRHSRRLLKAMTRHPQMILEDVDLPDGIREAIALVKDELSNKIAYLGPLREHPRASSEAFGRPRQPRDVGTRGERTAAVLSRFGQDKVRYVCPDGDMGESALAIAVAEWAIFFDIGSTVKTLEMGKQGQQIVVHDKSTNQDFDLTEVGFGVSQLLPILVGILASEPDGIVLLEQPEIHLHPRLQSRLGEFLVRQAGVGRQIICETHSEHLINRIRRLIAESEAEQISSDVGVYFVERNNGSSEFVKLELNELGGFTRWPDGFFDEAEVESERILRAALSKQRHADRG